MIELLAAAALAWPALHHSQPTLKDACEYAAQHSMALTIEDAKKCGFRVDETTGTWEKP
jgi:hypothetical protein